MGRRRATPANRASPAAGVRSLAGARAAASQRVLRGASAACVGTPMAPACLAEAAPPEGAQAARPFPAPLRCCRPPRPPRRPRRGTRRTGRPRWPSKLPAHPSRQQRPTQIMAIVSRLPVAAPAAALVVARRPGCSPPRSHPGAVDRRRDYEAAQDRQTVFTQPAPSKTVGYVSEDAGCGTVRTRANEEHARWLDAGGKRGSGSGDRRGLPGVR